MVLIAMSQSHQSIIDTNCLAVYISEVFSAFAFMQLLTGPAALCALFKSKDYHSAMGYVRASGLFSAILSSVFGRFCLSWDIGKGGHLHVLFSSLAGGLSVATVVIAWKTGKFDNINRNRNSSETENDINRHRNSNEAETEAFEFDRRSNFENCENSSTSVCTQFASIIYDAISACTQYPTSFWILLGATLRATHTLVLTDWQSLFQSFDNYSKKDEKKRNFILTAIMYASAGCCVLLFLSHKRFKFKLRSRKKVFTLVSVLLLSGLLCFLAFLSSSKKFKNIYFLAEVALVSYHCGTEVLLIVCFAEIGKSVQEIEKYFESVDIENGKVDFVTLFTVMGLFTIIIGAVVQTICSIMQINIEYKFGLYACLLFVICVASFIAISLFTFVFGKKKKRRERVFTPSSRELRQSLL
eukprot:g4604.t1